MSHSVGLASKDKIMSRRPTHFQLLSHRFARPQDLLVILLAGPDQGDQRDFFGCLEVKRA